MRMWNLLMAELRKIISLPGIWAGAAVGVLGSAAVTLLNAVTVRNAVTSGRTESIADSSPFETAVAGPTILISVAAVVIGVLSVSSEYSANSSDAGGGKQIAATLTAVPRRVPLLIAKSIIVVAAIVTIAAITLAVTIGIARAIIGDLGTENVTTNEAMTRCLGSLVYWVLTGLMAFAITIMARSGIIPLIILIMNSSVISISFLLRNVTSLANWLPDAAGRNLLGVPDSISMEGSLDTLPGGLVMGGWALVLVVIAGVVFTRRDA